MRHDQPQRVPVIGGQRLVVMVSGQKYVVSIQISKGYIGRESLFGVDQDVRRFRLGLCQPENFFESYSLPVVIKAAPASHAMKVAVRFDFGELVKLVPGEPNGSSHNAPNPEIPLGGIETRH